MMAAISCRTLISKPLLLLRPLAAAAACLRCYSAPRKYPSLTMSCNISNPPPTNITSKRGIVRSMGSTNFSHPPPTEEETLLRGCDYLHWLIVVDPPSPEPNRNDIIDNYVKMLAQVLGSEEAARLSMYSVSTKHYYAFGCIVSEALASKLESLPNVRKVLPDSYLDVGKKDYGGEPFINGEVVPYDPKYHKDWLKKNTEENKSNISDESHNEEQRANTTSTTVVDESESSKGQEDDTMENNTSEGDQSEENDTDDDTEIDDDTDDDEYEEEGENCVDINIFTTCNDQEAKKVNTKRIIVRVKSPSHSQCYLIRGSLRYAIQYGFAVRYFE